MEVEEQMDLGASGHVDPYTSVQNFEIEKKIGEGQFSEVYKARCVIDNSVIALKKVQVSL